MDETGASTVSSGADTAAPAPDSAAASAPPAADASNAPAAPQGNETAASTETGAPAAPASLDDIFKDFQSKASKETATPEAPAGDDTAPADQPEPEEKPDADDVAPEPEAEEAPAEDDPLADEAGIPTRDEINEAHKRAPKAVRDLAADMAERAAAAEGKLSKIGDEGLQVAEAIIPHLFTAQVTPENVNGMFDALVETNPQLVASMGEGFINAALNDERTGAAFGDRLLEGEFGEGYTAERLRELVELDRAGLIDVDSLREDLGTGREPTARERELEAKLDAANKQVKELTGGTEDATRREEQRLRDTVETEVTRALKAKIQPIRENLRWVEKEGDAGPHAGLLDELGELAEAKMNAALRQSPEWDAIQQLVADGGAFRDGKPTRLMRLNLQAIERRGTALFKGTARRLKPAISALAGQNAPTKEDPPPPQTTGRSEGDAATADRPAPPAPRKPQSLDEINAEYDRRMRESREPVGTTRRR